MGDRLEKLSGSTVTFASIFMLIGDLVDKNLAEMLLLFLLPIT